MMHGGRGWQDADEQRREGVSASDRLKNARDWTLRSRRLSSGHVRTQRRMQSGHAHLSTAVPNAIRATMDSHELRTTAARVAESPGRLSTTSIRSKNVPISDIVERTIRPIVELEVDAIVNAANE